MQCTNTSCQYVDLLYTHMAILMKDVKKHNLLDVRIRYEHRHIKHTAFAFLWLPIHPPILETMACVNRDMGQLFLVFLNCVSLGHFHPSNPKDINTSW